MQLLTQHNHINLIPFNQLINEKNNNNNKTKLMTRPDVDTQIAYKPGSGDRWPFLRAQLDLCGTKCHRPNITIQLLLEATPSGAGSQASNSNNNNNNNKKAHANNGYKSTQTGRSRIDSNKSEQRQRQVSNKLRPAAAPSNSRQVSSFHCDRDSYSMVSKRRLCGK